MGYKAGQFVGFLIRAKKFAIHLNMDRQLVIRVAGLACIVCCVSSISFYMDSFDEHPHLTLNK